MKRVNKYLGVNFNNLRKALYLLYFGYDEGKCESFDSPKYKYIIPMQGNFENPLELNDKDTFILYWIERDQSLTQDDYVEEEDGTCYNRQKCVATILVRFVGSEAEDWVKAFRHLAKRNDVGELWSGVCNAEKLEYTAPVKPQKTFYSGLNGEIAFDVRFKLYYDECIRINWLPLEGINMKVKGKVYTDDKDVRA